MDINIYGEFIVIDITHYIGVMTNLEEALRS